MLIIGLTGGIGAGKSAVAQRLAWRGAVVVDADTLAREVVAPGTDGFAEVVTAFGAKVVGDDGALDRGEVAAEVFADAAARQRLEEIVHPRVRARTAELTDAAPADAVVVNDVPLLVEAGLAPSYHLVIVVEADEEVRVERLTRSRDMSPEDARARIHAQASDGQRRAAADVVLRNDGPLSDLHAAVDALWRQRLLPFEENLRSGRPAARPPEVSVVDYDPTWPQQYERLAARLRHAAGSAALRVDHVGSTAVPGLVAKDIIDIQLTVADLGTADAIAGALSAAGFPPYPGAWHDTPKPDEPDPAVWEKRVHGTADPGRPVNLHVRANGSSGWRLNLLLRDWWRADEASRAEYAALKKRLSGQASTRQEYAEAKEPWFDDVWARVSQWAREVGWRP